MNTIYVKKKYSMMKRGMDVLVSSAILLLISPLLASIACMIRISSKGRIFHHEERIGRNGQLFSSYQFRTHLEDKRSISTQTSSLGNVLKRFSLHKLPFFWNILKGDLSFIGPEPCSQLDMKREYYGSDCTKRLSVRPGLTGIWRLSHKFSPGSTRSFCRYLDEQYVHHFGLKLDLKILYQTLLILIPFKAACSIKNPLVFCNHANKSYSDNDHSRSKSIADYLISVEDSLFSLLDLKEFLPETPFQTDTLLAIKNIIDLKKARKIVMIGAWLGSIVQAVAKELSDQGVIYDINMWLGSLPEKLDQQDPNLPYLQQMFLENMNKIKKIQLVDKVIPLTMNVTEAVFALNFHPDLIYFDNRRFCEKLVDELSSCISILDHSTGILCGNCWLNKEVQEHVSQSAKKLGCIVQSEKDFWWFKR